jgi:hypothetical protein
MGAYVSRLVDAVYDLAGGNEQPSFSSRILMLGLDNAGMSILCVLFFSSSYR